jgi:hypothetical protein
MHGIHIAVKALLLSVVAAAVGILVAAMLIFAANNPSVAPTQVEPSLPPRPLAAILSTGTPEQCGVLPNPQRPDNAECVRKRSKEYAERLVRWLEEHPEISKFSEDVDPGMIIKPNGDSSR